MGCMVTEPRPTEATTPSGGTAPLVDVVSQVAARMRDNLAPILVARAEVVDLALVALLCEGHILVEDVPGVGKTTLARALAESIGGTFRRLQCTPDLLPSDVTGVSVFDQAGAEFVFKPGPVFANVLLADEINRATPRTQSSLLECMQERQVTADGETRLLPRPFIVLATQNPVELEGTFPLPEAQLDRFLLRIRLGYPDLGDEERILMLHAGELEMPVLAPVARASEWVELQRACRALHVAPPVRRYIVEVVRATREARAVLLGASPRATLGLYHAAQAWAALRGRSFVKPDDVKRIAGPVLAHRLLLSGEARVRGRSAEAVIEDLLREVPVPVEDPERV